MRAFHAVRQVHAEDAGDHRHEREGRPAPAHINVLGCQVLVRARISHPVHRVLGFSAKGELKVGGGCLKKEGWRQDTPLEGICRHVILDVTTS